MVTFVGSDEAAGVVVELMTLSFSLVWLLLLLVSSTEEEEEEVSVASNGDAVLFPVPLGASSCVELDPADWFCHKDPKMPDFDEEETFVPGIDLCLVSTLIWMLWRVIRVRNNQRLAPTRNTMARFARRLIQRGLW